MEHEHGAFKVNREIKALPVNWARTAPLFDIGDRGPAPAAQKFHAGKL